MIIFVNKELVFKFYMIRDSWNKKVKQNLRVAGLSPSILLQKNSGAGVFLSIYWNLWKKPFFRTRPVAAFNKSDFLPI